MGKNSKRPKSYYINKSKRKKTSNELNANMVGFLCTCNNKEKACLNEAYNLLNEFANNLYGEKNEKKENSSGCDLNVEPQTKKSSQSEKEDTDDTESDNEDIESALKGQIETLKMAQMDKCERRFQQVNVKVNNCLFISTTLSDPVELCLAIMEDILIQQKPRTHYLLRMVPVQKTCKAFIEDIEKSVKELIFEKFPKNKTSFYIAFKARNNNSLQRDVILKTLSNIITSYNLEAVAEYQTPELVLNVDILKNICCLGLLPHYLTKYAKYNLLKLLTPNDLDTEIKEAS